MTEERKSLCTFRSLRQRASAGGYPNWTQDECNKLLAAVEAAVVYRDKQRRSEASAGDALLLDQALSPFGGDRG